MTKTLTLASRAVENYENFVKQRKEGFDAFTMNTRSKNVGYDTYEMSPAMISRLEIAFEEIEKALKDERDCWMTKVEEEISRWK